MYYKYGHGWTETTDGTIPHKLFLLLLDSMSVIEAGDELVAGKGAALGISLAMSGDKPDVQRRLHSLVQSAFPERYD